MKLNLTGGQSFVDLLKRCVNYKTNWSLGNTQQKIQYEYKPSLHTYQKQVK